MGVVYKAEDTKLKRLVALKFLSAISLGGEEKNRFLREAQAAASLNHPNICTIYTIDEADDRMFMAMEFIKGQSLQEKIRGEPLKIETVIKFAMQIAEGLQAAHEKGIIHRDIKNANIMITEKGQAKIMDFGLAKLAGLTAITKEGTTFGTVAYMSPEQVQGLEVDHRTDIWSLGVVIYEMLSGRLPFQGEFDQAMMYAIVNKDAEPLTSLRSNVPLELERVVAKMLAKDPATRYQHVDELPADLRALEKGSLGKLSKRVATAPAATWQRARLAWRIAALMTLVAATALGWLIIRPSSTERFISRSLILPPDNTTFNADHGIHAAISPDGRRIAFVATDFAGVNSLWVRSLSTLTATPLNGTEDASFPFWSPDGRTLGFFRGGKLKKIDAAGGPALTICDAPNGRGGAWNKDGIILFAPSESGILFKVAASGDTPIQATTLDRTRGEIIQRWPHFLPDGNHFIFSAHSISSTGMSDTLKLGILERPTSTALLPTAMNAVYASGHLIYLQEGTLMARPFDTARLKFTAEATPIAENVQYRPQPIGKANFSVSQNGVMVLQAGNANLDRFAFFDREGNRLAVLPEQAEFGARFSPDGKLIAFPRFDAQSRFDIWVRDLSRGTASRLTFDPAIDSRPVWSPDGRFIVFSSTRRKGHRDLFIKNMDGTGEEQLLLETEFNKFATSWSRDGRYIAFISDTRTKTGVDVDLWLLPLRNANPLLFSKRNSWSR
jgi:serine/threonine protein kinase